MNVRNMSAGTSAGQSAGASAGRECVDGSEGSDLIFKPWPLPLKDVAH